MKNILFASAIVTALAFARPAPESFLQGDVNFPVIMVSTSDRASGDSALYHRFLNEKGFSEQGHIGSVRDYFIANSGGMFKPSFDVFKVTVKGNLDDFYGNEPELMYTVLIQLPAKLDCKKYDANKDSYVDAFIVVFAGSEYGTKFVSHQNSLGKLHKYYLNGYDFDRYVMVAEKDQYDEEDEILNGMGAFIHEFLHGLGLADHYDVNTLSGGTGVWDIMAQGMNNGDFENSFTGRIPPKINAFERESLGWLKLKELNADEGGGGVKLASIDSNVAYSVTNPKNKNEYFVVEYRPQTTWDTELYEPGILIWHVDYDSLAWAKNELNITGKPQHFELVKAADVGYQSATPFPGKQNVTEYEFKFKDGTSADVGIYNIQVNGEIAYFSTDKSDSFKLPGAKPADDKPSEEKPSENEPSEEKPSEDKPSDDNAIVASSMLKAELGVANNVLNVNVPFEGAKSVRIFDVRGNVAFETRFEGNSISLALRLPAGVYLANVKTQGKSFTKRVVVGK